MFIHIQMIYKLKNILFQEIYEMPTSRIEI
jgi:hypothetical protein